MLVGDDAKRGNLIKIKQRIGLDIVLMLTKQKKEKVPNILEASDAWLFLLGKTCLLKNVIASKILEVMAMKRAIILGVQGESADFVGRTDCGVCNKPENTRQLTDTILKLSIDSIIVDKLGKDGGLFVRTHYTCDNLAKAYLDVLDEVAAH